MATDKEADKQIRLVCYKLKICLFGVTAGWLVEHANQTKRRQRFVSELPTDDDELAARL